MTQLRSIYDRWQRLEDDKAAISEDLKELFAEAKANGFDSKALRIAFRLKAKSEGPEAAAVAETAAMVEMYLAELGSGTRIATHAHPRVAHETDLGDAREPRSVAAEPPGGSPKKPPATIPRLRARRDDEPGVSRWMTGGLSLGGDPVHLPSLGVSSLKLDGLRPVLFSPDDEGGR